VYSRNKNIDTIVKELVRNGWEPARRSRHWQVKSPNGNVLTIPNTPSDGRALLNFRADLKRYLQIQDDLKR